MYHDVPVVKELDGTKPINTPQEGIALAVRDLKKRYGSTIARNGVSFEVAAGTVHALLGENGAGKSTLVRMLSGLTQADSGEICVFGRPARVDGPRFAHGLGIRTAFQEISLVKDLTVAQNFLLMEEEMNGLGMIRRRRCEEFVKGELDRLGVHGVDPRRLAGDLDLPTRQKIEIARSVSRNPKVLLLDEPTASLGSQDVQWLGQLIDERTAVGTTIVFISHRMQEVREFCTSLSILRNGTCVATSSMGSFTDDEVIEMMIGRSLKAVFPPKRPLAESARATPALSVQSLRLGDTIDDVSFDLSPGQVLGVAGLQGMGQRELFMALFGALQPDSGEIAVDGKTAAFFSPADAKAVGIGLVPEDRKSEGLFLGFDGRQNLPLPVIDRFSRLGLVDETKQTQAVLDTFEKVEIPARALVQTAQQFSGGNQQKMVLARWLLAESRILLLYDPTRGVDVGTKAEIYRLIAECAADDKAILLYSSDIAELVNLCGEVMVLYRGRVSGNLSADDVNETQIMRAALGASHSSEVVR
jgi:ribose transport system ATP-binding protein